MAQSEWHRSRRRSGSFVSNRNNMSFLACQGHRMAVAILAFGILVMTNASAQDPPASGKVAIVVHGGAGTILRENMSAESEEAYRTALEHALRTGHAVLTAGGSSVDAVVAAIQTMEESPLFNAGRAFLLVLLLNRLTVLLSFVGIALAASYPFMKRLTYLPQVYLGAAFGWAVPMVFAAQTNTVPPLAWLMFTATVLWATAYDTMYAMVDRDDDIALGIKSTAILFGDLDRRIIGLIQGMLLVCLLMIGHQAELGLYYYLGVLVAAGLAAWQQHLIRYRDRDGCFNAFLNNNWFGATVFLGIYLDYLVI